MEKIKKYIKNGSKKKQIINNINDRLIYLTDELNNNDSDDVQEYIIDDIERLTKVKAEMNDGLIIKSIDLGSVLKVVAGVIVIGGILRYEKEDIITSKAFNIGGKIIGI